MKLSLQEILTIIQLALIVLVYFLYGLKKIIKKHENRKAIKYEIQLQMEEEEKVKNAAWEAYKLKKENQKLKESEKNAD